MEVHKFWGGMPARKEVMEVWRNSKALGIIPRGWTFAKHGRLLPAWGGYLLEAVA